MVANQFLFFLELEITKYVASILLLIVYETCAANNEKNE